MPVQAFFYRISFWVKEARRSDVDGASRSGNGREGEGNASFFRLYPVAQLATPLGPDCWGCSGWTSQSVYYIGIQ